MKEETYIDSDGQELTKKTWHNGDIEYTNKQDHLHRLDGPAVLDSDGYKAWYNEGDLHRLDGPAIIWEYGNEYYLYNKEVTKREVDLLWLKKQVEK